MTPNACSLVIGIASLVLSACFSKPGPPTEAQPDDARVLDGSPDDALMDIEDAAPDARPLPNCTLYDFNSGVGCGTWGTIDLGDASIANGLLYLTVPDTNAAATARCNSAARATSQVTVELASLPDLKTHRVALFVEVMSQRTSMEVYENGGISVDATCKGLSHATAFAPSGVGWLRMVANGTSMEMQISTTGSTWVTLGSTCSVPLSNAVIGLEVVRPAAGGQASTSFESLELCP